MSVNHLWPDYTLEFNVVLIGLALLGEYSYSNNWAKKIMGLYLYSTGSQRQPLSVMSQVGLSESYDAVIKNDVAKRRNHSPCHPAINQFYPWRLRTYIMKPKVEASLSSPTL
jgi:hypothetical protein